MFWRKTYGIKTHEKNENAKITTRNLVMDLMNAVDTVFMIAKKIDEKR